MYSAFYCFTIFLLFLFSRHSLCAQQQLTLQTCVDLAIKNGLTIRQANLQEQIAANTLFQSKANYLPQINAQANFRRTFGTTFDQVTFSRIEQATSIFSPSIALSFDLFAGLAKYYTLEQNKSAFKAAGAGVKLAQNTVITNVLLAYLQVVFDKNNIRLAQERLALLNKQLTRQEQLFKAGVTTEANVLNTKAQLATEEVNLVNQQAALVRNTLRLLQLLQLDANGNYEIVVPDSARLSVPTNELPPVQTYEQAALNTMPEIAQARHRLIERQFAHKVAAARYYPSLSFTTGLGSSYSTNGGQTRIISYLPLQIERTRTELAPQLTDNIGTFIGLGLTVPILNGLQVRQSVQQTRLNIELSALELKTQQDNVIRTVQQAYQDVVAARARLKAVNTQLLAAKAAFELAELQYEKGVINFYNFNEALNNKTRAEVDFIQAQYEYFFRYKLLEFYRGESITF